MVAVPRSARLLILALILSAGLGTGWFLFFPLPQAAVRGLVLSSASWIVSDYTAAPDGTLAHVRNLGRKLLAAHLQHSLVYHLEARHSLPKGLSDVERIVHVLARVRPLLVPASEIEQPVAGWQSLITGLGYCDQINGVAAQALAFHFSRAETYAIVDPETGVSPHTLGRVWSDERNGWIYWDIFFDTVDVFTLEDEQVYLIASEMGVDALQGQPLAPVYQLIPHGRTLNEYHRTFGGYLAFKIRQSFENSSSYPLAPRPASGMQVQQLGDGLGEDLTHSVDTLISGDAHRIDNVIRTYLEARMHHVLGDPVEAAMGYKRVVRLTHQEGDLRVRLIRRAAMMLGDRLAVSDRR